MRSWLGVIVVLVLGCVPQTRRAVVYPSRAEALGNQIEVVSLNGERVSGVVGKTDGGGYVLHTDEGHVPLASSDVLGVDIKLIDQATAPSEVGVDRAGRLRAAGVVTLVVGATLTSIGVVGYVTTAPPQPCTFLCFDLDVRPLYIMLASLGTGASLTGIALLIASALRTVPGRRVTIAPLVSPSVAGGALHVVF